VEPIVASHPWGLLVIGSKRLSPFGEFHIGAQKRDEQRRRF
jgi:hypothetical protein